MLLFHGLPKQAGMEQREPETSDSVDQQQESNIIGLDQASYRYLGTGVEVRAGRALGESFRN